MTESPACNTGVHPPAISLQEPPKSPAISVANARESRFDWYRATVPTSVENLTRHCMDIAGPYARIVDGHGRFNYPYSRAIEQGGDRVATILHGGKNGHPNVEASGDRAPALAVMLRQGGQHFVTRADVAVDLYGSDVFRRGKRIAAAIKRQFGINYRDVKNSNPDEGDTRYIASRQSDAFARVYEKGKADRKHYGDEHSDLLDCWVRIELEVKPKKEVREAAATWEPDQFWGANDWTRYLAKEAFNMAAEPIPFRPHRMSNDDRSFGVMCRQYRNLLHRRLQTVHQGDRDALAQEILSAVFDEQEAAA